ncbi:MAG: hypothetical protein IKM91_08725, partial [Candidatus Methanomethylophilaceae archaeon]|nr:hypothetical protein [Candidatus Methanomethylophilaceae archaeon]MBR6871679.1 hypothetical protein [Candidatus Methanomethylophilaceae archaeon]
GYGQMLEAGILEIVSGVVITLVVNFLRGRDTRIKQSRRRSIIRRKKKTPMEEDDLEDAYDAVY